MSLASHRRRGLKEPQNFLAAQFLSHIFPLSSFKSTTNSSSKTGPTDAAEFRTHVASGVVRKKWKYVKKTGTQNLTVFSPIFFSANGKIFATQVSFCQQQMMGDK